MQHKSDVEAADALKHAYEQIRTEIGKVIVGQDEVIKLVNDKGQQQDIQYGKRSDLDVAEIEPLHLAKLSFLWEI